MRKVFVKGSIDMVDIPIGKALMAVKRDNTLLCKDCFFYNVRNCFKKMACRSSYRLDDKDVIFKLIDINKDTGG